MLTNYHRVKEFLGIPETETNHDAVISTLLARVEATISDDCDRVFEYDSSITEYHDGRKANTVQLKQYPVDSAVDVELYDDTEREYGSATQYATTDFSVDLESGIVTLDGNLTFHNSNRNVKVVYAAGYKAIPQDLERVAILLTAADFLGSQGQLEVTIGVEVSMRTSGYRKEADKILLRYKRIAL